jgi:hypothetical protein
MANSPAFIEWLLTRPIFFAIFFCVVWAMASFVISMASGWNVLSKRFYCAKGTFHGETRTFQSARMGFLTNYGSCLRIGADKSGLYMSIFPIFRLGHPPLLIPWEEITICPGETGLIFKQRTFTLGRQEAISLRISASLVASLQQAVGKGWPDASIG